MPRRLNERSADASSAIELSELSAGIAEAVLDAKARLDRQTAVIADEYKASPTLAMLGSPAFSIAEVRATIKFAIARIDHNTSTRRGSERHFNRVYVYADSASLAKIALHLVSEIEFRITPEIKRPQPIGDDGNTQG